MAIQIETQLINIRFHILLCSNFFFFFILCGLLFYGVRYISKEIHFSEGKKREKKTEREKKRKGGQEISL